MSEWQPIETAPKDGTEFVAAYARQGFVKQLVYFSQLHEIWKSKDEWIPGFETNATHWMPLPEPPTEEQDMTPEIQSTLDTLNKKFPCNPPWSEGQYVSVSIVHTLLEDRDGEIDRLRALLGDIGDIAHDARTGPAIPDVLWEIRRMAYAEA